MYACVWAFAYFETFESRAPKLFVTVSVVLCVLVIVYGCCVTGVSFGLLVDVQDATPCLFGLSSLLFSIALVVLSVWTYRGLQGMQNKRVSVAGLEKNQAVRNALLMVFLQV